MSNKNKTIEFKAIYNVTEYGVFLDKSIICGICKEPKSVAIVFDKLICADCLSIARTCILRKVGVDSGLIKNTPPYKNKPIQTFPIKDKE